MKSDSDDIFDARKVFASTPDNVATMPDIVGMVAAETPAAMVLALPPDVFIASNT